MGWPSRLSEIGGGENDFHPIYLFNISNCCVFLTAMDVMLGNPLPVVKGPNQLPVKYSWKIHGGKVANDAFYQVEEVLFYFYYIGCFYHKGCEVLSDCVLRWSCDCAPFSVNMLCCADWFFCVGSALDSWGESSGRGVQCSLYVAGVGLLVMCWGFLHLHA